MKARVRPIRPSLDGRLPFAAPRSVPSSQNFRLPGHFAKPRGPPLDACFVIPLCREVHSIWYFTLPANTKYSVNT